MSGRPVAQVFFVLAPYIGPLVRNALDATVDKVEMLSTPAGIEILFGGQWHVVPFSNVKCYRLA